MDAIVQKLTEHASQTPSKWKERAKFRLANREWLNLSQQIAIKILEKMDMENISLQELAERLNCSPQYATKILKGNKNLSLDAIAKIEHILDVSLLPNAVEFA